MRKLTPYIAALGAISIWGLAPVFAKLVLLNSSIPTFLVLRFFSASIILLWLFPSIIKNIYKIRLSEWFKFIIVIFLLFYSQTYAIDNLPVAYYIILFSFSPIITYTLLRFSYTWSIVNGIIISIIGIITFLYHDSGQYHLNFISLFSLLVGILSWTYYSILIKRFHIIYSDLQITAITSYIALVSSLIFYAFHHPLLLLIKTEYIVYGLLIGAILTLAFFLYSFSMRHQPIFSTFIQYLEPIIGLFGCALIFGQHLSFLQYFSSLLVIIGVIIIEKNTAGVKNEKPNNSVPIST